MKGLFVIPISILHFTFSVGVVISSHFCGGKLDEISFFKQPKECCADANEAKSCCKNTTSIVKITDSYNIDVTSLDAPQLQSIGLAYQIVFNTEYSLVSANQAFDLSQIRHPDKQQPIYLTNRVFII